MKAILLVEGFARSIYLLAEDNGVCEVRDYFDRYRGNPKFKSYINGFIKYFDVIKGDGFKKFNSNQRKCWEEGGNVFCELIKGPERLSYFDYSEEKKVLIISQFSKHMMKEKKEYKRAIRLRKAFEDTMVWEG